MSDANSECPPHDWSGGDEATGRYCVKCGEGLH